MKKLNEKYVLLLQKSYEKHKNLSVIEISNKDAKEDLRRGEISDAASLKDYHKVTQKSKSKTRVTCNPKKKNECKNQQVKHPMINRFTPEEDEFLSDAIRNGKHKNYKKLASLMNRKYASVRLRILKLLSSSKENKKRLPFTLTEDLSIIDAAINFITEWHGVSSLYSVLETPSLSIYFIYLG